MAGGGTNRVTAMMTRWAKCRFPLRRDNILSHGTLRARQGSYRVALVNWVVATLGGTLPVILIGWFLIRKYAPPIKGARTETVASI